MQDVRDIPGVSVDLAGVDLDVLEEIQRRVLWLAVRIVDAANRERETGDGVKVGGHQASSASLVTAMTALWFAHLRAEDRVSVKPHASPVFAAAVRRYVDAHWTPPEGRPPRFVALLGDAELDEGNVWEAIADPATQ